MTKTLDEVMTAARCCIANSGLFCLKCPYSFDSESCRINHNKDVLFYLEKCKDILNEEQRTKDLKEFKDFIEDVDYETLSLRCSNALRRGGITSIKQFAETSPGDIFNIRNIGVVSLKFLLYKHVKAREMLGLKPLKYEEGEGFDNYKENK